MDPSANETAQGADDAKGQGSANDVEHRKKPRQSTLTDLTGTPLPTGAEARDRRDAALDGITLRADPAWLTEAQRALLAAIDRLGSACVDDCRDAIPPPRLACWWCIVPRMLCARDLIHRVGSRPGRATVTHGGDLRLWARVAVDSECVNNRPANQGSRASAEVKP